MFQQKYYLDVKLCLNNFKTYLTYLTLEYLESLYFVLHLYKNRGQRPYVSKVRQAVYALTNIYVPYESFMLVMRNDKSIYLTTRYNRYTCYMSMVTKRFTTLDIKFHASSIYRQLATFSIPKLNEPVSSTFLLKFFHYSDRWKIILWQNLKFKLKLILWVHVLYILMNRWFLIKFKFIYRQKQEFWLVENVQICSLICQKIIY